MKHFEDPTQFDIKKKVGDTELVYSNLMEISQGGPEVGSLSINGHMLEGRYGGPAIFHNEYIYVPAYVKKFIKKGFKLVRIKVTNLELEYWGKIKDLIFLDKVEENRIYFFEDISKTILNSYEIKR